MVIVNHHLLCADAAVRQNAYGEVIPSCSYAIVDEAHQLEDVATQYFGFSISTYRLEDYARDVERFIKSGAVTTRSAQDELQKGIDRLRDHARAFFTELAFAHRTSDRARGEERVRATDASLAHTREVAAYLAGVARPARSGAGAARGPPDHSGDGEPAVAIRQRRARPARRRDPR